ncbi:MchS3 family protein [uncultured Herbaspirillum sp.]|uniref:MchS3 family protein n=1 Tax=uncultured Herbaspirillum sp. TaxID=160236 RepID=UPI00261D8626|nr:MchS3 family protein [uncultured Herbaspirillum sp.]
MKIAKNLYLVLMVTWPLAEASALATDDMEALKRTSTFALGQVGFISHISESEQRYRRLLQAPAALDLFTQLVGDTSATNEARLYAACAIRTLDAKRFEQLTHTLRASGGDVSILRSDILQRESIQDQLQRIAQHGCADAYWR